MPHNHKERPVRQNAKRQDIPSTTANSAGLDASRTLEPRRINVLERISMPNKSAGNLSLNQLKIQNGTKANQAIG